jgi:hypothetical protein
METGEINVTDLLSRESTGFMKIGIGALQSIIMTLGKLNREVRLKNVEINNLITKDIEQGLVIKRLEVQIRDLEDTTLKVKCITKVTGLDRYECVA